MADTSTVGGVISGYWAMGRLKTEIPPARTTMIDSTEAKIGRSMKKRENMNYLSGRLRLSGKDALSRKRHKDLFLRNDRGLFGNLRVAIRRRRPIARGYGDRGMCLASASGNKDP